MSLSQQRRKKAKRRQRTPEERSIQNKIRNGTFPRYFLATNSGGVLERDTKGRLTFRLISTYKALTELPESKNEIQTDIIAPEVPSSS